MPYLEIKVESLPQRCEVCHQTDCFDPQTNFCTRCAGVVYTPPLQIFAKPEPEYFWAVSPLKLIVMSICTLGLYQLYWFYKNWDIINDRQRLGISPGLRSFFSVIFCYSLFKKIKQVARELNIKTRLSPALMTLLFICLGFISSLLIVLALLPVQILINKIHMQASPHREINNRFSVANIVTIVIASILFILALAGSFGGPVTQHTRYSVDYGEIKREAERARIYSNTTLKEAAISGQRYTVEKLIADGADVNMKDNAGATPLMYAAETGKSDIIRILYAAGADVNVKDVNGLTALMHATNNSDETSVKLLLELGADVKAKNNIGKTAMDYAIENRTGTDKKYIIRLLKTAGVRK